MRATFVAALLLAAACGGASAPTPTAAPSSTPIPASTAAPTPPPNPAPTEAPPPTPTVSPTPADPWAYATIEDGIALWNSGVLQPDERSQFMQDKSPPQPELLNIRDHYSYFAGTLVPAHRPGFMEAVEQQEDMASALYETARFALDLPLSGKANLPGFINAPPQSISDARDLPLAEDLVIYNGD